MKKKPTTLVKELNIAKVHGKVKRYHNTILRNHDCAVLNQFHGNYFVNCKKSGTCKAVNFKVFRITL